MNATKITAGVVLVAILAVAVATAQAAGKTVRPPPEGYDHTKFAPEPDILKIFRGFAVSFDSKDDDDGEPGPDLLRVSHWVAQELRRWEPPVDDREDDAAWCLKDVEEAPEVVYRARPVRLGRRAEGRKLPK